MHLPEQFEVTDTQYRALHARYLSLDIVSGYTRSVKLEDSLSLYTSIMEYSVAHS